MNHYLSSARTKGVLKFISSDTGIPVSLLVQVTEGVKKGSRASDRSQGTWIHPRAAMHLAQWVSNEFAGIVSGWVLEIVGKDHVDLRPQSPVAPAPSADIARLDRLESLVTQLAHAMTGIMEQLAGGNRALPGQSSTVRQMCEQSGWFTSTALNRRRILARARDVLHEYYFCGEGEAGDSRGIDLLAFR